MRVTNKMIMNNASSNINSTKECVNTRNKQMTSQKKIDRPSDDPVVAVRSLRLSTTLSQVTQYYSKNIPDATSWLDVTETSLINIRSLMTDCRSLAVKGSTDTYNAEDRSTMITQLEALQKQVFAEGNADYAKRTVFTGYRTNSNLVFTEDETETKYRINQTLTAEENMEEHRYYDGVNAAPATADQVKNAFLDKSDANYLEIRDMAQTDYYRVRLNYGEISTLNKIEITSADGSNVASFSYFSTGAAEDDVETITDTSVLTSNGYSLVVYENEEDWSKGSLNTWDNQLGALMAEKNLLMSKQSTWDETAEGQTWDAAYADWQSRYNAYETDRNTWETNLATQKTNLDTTKATLDSDKATLDQEKADLDAREKALAAELKRIEAAGGPYANTDNLTAYQRYLSDKAALDNEVAAWQTNMDAWTASKEQWDTEYEAYQNSIKSTYLKEENEKTVPDDGIVVIKETGDIILGKNVAAALKNKNATIDVQYDKIGFNEGELRPEYYYNCQKRYDPNDVDTNIPYTKYDENGKRIYFDIEYTVAANQTININTEACDVFTSDIQRDLAEMIDAVKRTIDAHNKLDEITKMKGESQYASDEYQEYLGTWYDALKKEADFFEDNLQKLFSTELGKIDEYYATISLGITDLGCKKDSLKLTEKRVGDQRETVQGLQSTNDDLDLSQIIIDYTAAYTAYQASLTAAGKLGESTLLNYL